MVLEEHGNYRSFSAGEIVFKQGDEGEHMYVVDSGHVEIVVDSGGHELQLSVLGPEEIFGEMAIFGGETRSATARAVDKCGVREISQEDVYKFVHDPLARKLLRVMGARLRDVDAKLLRLRDEAEVSGAQLSELLASRSRYG